MRRFLLFLVLASSSALAQTNWPTTIIENLPTASLYADTASSVRGGTGTIGASDTLVATMVFVDRVSFKKGRGALKSDTLPSFTDAAAYTHGLNLPSESFLYADNQTFTHGTTGVGHTSSSPDTLLVAMVYNDSVAVSRNLAGAGSGIFPSTTLTYSDSVGRGLSIHPSDSFIVTSTVCANSAFNGLRENLAENDHPTVNAVVGGTGNSRSITEIRPTQSDGASRLLALSILPQESFTFSDFLGSQGINPVPLSETLSHSDSATVPRSSVRSETFSFSDLTLTPAAHNARLSEAFVYTEGVRVCGKNSGRCRHRAALILTGNQ